MAIPKDILTHSTSEIELSSKIWTLQDPYGLQFSLDIQKAVDDISKKLKANFIDDKTTKRAITDLSVLFHASKYELSAYKKELLKLDSFLSAKLKVHDEILHKLSCDGAFNNLSVTNLSCIKVGDSNLLEIIDTLLFERIIITNNTADEAKKVAINANKEAVNAKNIASKANATASSAIAASAALKETVDASVLKNTQLDTQIKKLTTNVSNVASKIDNITSKINGMTIVDTISDGSTTLPSNYTFIGDVDTGILTVKGVK